MTQKIVGVVTSCMECRHRQGRTCTLVDQTIVDSSVVASFCTLPDFPASTLAAQERTIQYLRQGREFGIHAVILSYLAARLNTNVEAHGRGLVLTTRIGDVYLDFAAVTEVQFQSSVCFNFRHDGKQFQLLPEADPPRLNMAVDPPGNEDRPLWESIKIGEP